MEEERSFALEDEQADMPVELARADMPINRPPAHPDDNDNQANLQPEGQLTIDVYQTPTEIVIESAVAGVSPSDLDIHVSTDSVTVRGERRREKEVKDEDYLYQECYWGRFSRSVILPQEIDPENVQATFKNGVLKIRLPKLTRTKAKKIKVQLE